jgi:hypothetical protein
MANDHEISGEPTAVARGPRTPSGRLPAVWAVPSEPPKTELGHAQADAIFELLVAVMWSDGELDTAEVARGRAAAEVMQLRPRRGGAFTAMADGALPFGEIEIDALSGLHRRLAYAAAEWLAEAPSSASDRRSGFVRALQMRLGITDDDAQVLGELALGLARECDDPKQAFAALMRGVLQPAEAAE